MSAPGPITLLVAGIALILIGTGALLAIDNSRGCVRQVGANLGGFALVFCGAVEIALALRALL